MKEVYIPSTKDLYIMQDKGMNIYKYLLVKVIELIIMESKVYKTNNESILLNTYKYLRENIDINLAICNMYPEEIKYSIYAQNDIKLCLKLTNQDYEKDKSIYNLDNLSYFEQSKVLYSNRIVVDSIIKILIEKLPFIPRYRFEYKDNKLLDDIFACRINYNIIDTQIKSLSQIEPAYILLDNNINSQNTLNQIIDTYGERYGISKFECNEYINQDILTNPDIEVKRLLKCIDERKIKR